MLDGTARAQMKGLFLFADTGTASRASEASEASRASQGKPGQARALEEIMGVVRSNWLVCVLASILHRFKPSCRPMFKPPPLGPPLVPLKLRTTCRRSSRSSGAGGMGVGCGSVDGGSKGDLEEGGGLSKV